jgi:hypothetical protein
MGYESLQAITGEKTFNEQAKATFPWADREEAARGPCDAFREQERRGAIVFASNQRSDSQPLAESIRQHEERGSEAAHDGEKQLFAMGDGFRECEASGTVRLNDVKERILTSKRRPS